MRKHDRIIVELAVEILRSATETARAECVGTVEVRLALRCLLPHCPERWPLASFWKAATWDDDARPTYIRTAFDGTVRQLWASKAYDGPLF